MDINKRNKFIQAIENGEKFDTIELNSFKQNIKSTIPNTKFKKVDLLVVQKKHKIFNKSFRIIVNILKFRMAKPIIVTVLILYVLYNIQYINEKLPIFNHLSMIKGSPSSEPTKVPSKYLVWSDNCKIPDIDPYDPEVMKYLKKQNYENCSLHKPFTSVQFNSTTKQYTLNINETLKVNFGLSLNCCYQAIIRKQKGKKADNKIILSECLAFNETVQLSNTIDNILVKCYNDNHTQVYIHGHPMMPERNNINKRLDAWKNNNTNRAPSILMIGIDSVSRLNLLRAMPKTAEILKINEWFEISGYNEIGDGTFPNLMAALTGYNYSTARRLCFPHKLHITDNCPMIWKLFKDHGYITAYAEDAASISTFNYLNLGFEVPPVDYYLRPFMIAAERIFSFQERSGLKFCLGYQHSADYVYDYALELGTRFKYEPYFGLFWSNTFSHHSINDCSSMDIKVTEYLEELSTRGILNESVVIFFSDHGIRWGNPRDTVSGYFEERLPFMFISLPQWLKTKFPEFVYALNVNKNRLTNPFDIHMTLKNLLELSGRTATDLPKAKDCPNCQSLLSPVLHNRSCDDIAITDHFCSCLSFLTITTKSHLVHKLAIFVVDYINDYVQNFKNGTISYLCENMQLHNIIRAYAIVSGKYPNNLQEFRLVLNTRPGFALFEATIRRKTDNNELQIIGEISRLNSYAKDAQCISYSMAKKYCHCSTNNGSISH